MDVGGHKWPLFHQRSQSTPTPGASPGVFLFVQRRRETEAQQGFHAAGLHDGNGSLPSRCSWGQIASGLSWCQRVPPRRGSTVFFPLTWGLRTRARLFRPSGWSMLRLETVDGRRHDKIIRQRLLTLTFNLCNNPKRSTESGVGEETRKGLHPYGLGALVPFPAYRGPGILEFVLKDRLGNPPSQLVGRGMSRIAKIAENCQRIQN
jgi:hypothetical protein